jgi:aspartyl aminopeptidase
MKKEIANAIELVDFAYDSPCSFFAVKNIKKILNDNDFVELEENKEWTLEKGKNYYLSKNESAVFIFSVGKNLNLKKEGFRIIAAHTDSPSLKVKSVPEIISDKYLKLNIEKYGAPILSTWFDRPLSMAGKIITKGDSVFDPKVELLKIERPLFIIPSLAIHLDKKDNKNSINPQIELLPLAANIEKEDKNEYFLKLIASELHVDKEDILDYEIYLYEYEKGDVIGVENEYISSPRLDNLEAVYAGLKALNNSKNDNNINMLAFFDNEEVGSMTKQGADSNYFSSLLERIYYNFESSKEGLYTSYANSFLISADAAHAYHPNYGEKYDITNRAYMNSGVTIKINANQKYSTDSYSSAIIKELANKAEIKLQKYFNRSDQRGGSTVGPIISSKLGIQSVDLGVPLLAMHSIRELIGIYDHYDLIKLFEVFYKQSR